MTIIYFSFYGLLVIGDVGTPSWQVDSLMMDNNVLAVRDAECIIDIGSLVVTEGYYHSSHKLL